MQRSILTTLALLLSGAIHAAEKPIPVGDRLEIFVDRHLIDSMDGVTLTMGQPRPEEIVMTFDNPWEGGSSAAYPTVIKDGKTYRMYYRGGARAPEGLFKSGTLFASMGVVPTSESEMSFYVSTNYMLPSHHIRRYSLRTDGFASLRAPLAGGTVMTKPVVFSGGKLALNYWTSAAGSIRVEILGESGKPLPGYRMGDCPEIVGNEMAREVTWAGGRNAESLIGTAVKLRFRIADADLYSLRFVR